MIESPQPDYPSFDQAEDRFRAFVQSQGLTERFVYVTTDDLVVLGSRWFVRRLDPDRARTTARETYDEAVRQGRGVSLTAHCLLNGSLCVHVHGPIDDDEAERLMYPNGLKISIPARPPIATAVSPLRLAALRRWQLLNPEQRQRQIELLK
jgi:hypothetical protein